MMRPRIKSVNEMRHKKYSVESKLIETSNIYSSNFKESTHKKKIKTNIKKILGKTTK